MSEYLSKKALLEWLKKRLDETQFVKEAHALAEIVAKIECGRFDDDQTEVQRLRAALEMAQSELRWGDPANAIERVERIIDEALSTTSEPTVAERVREEIKGLLEVWDFRGIAEQLESGYEKSVVIELVELCEKLVGINTPEGDGNDA